MNDVEIDDSAEEQEDFNEVDGGKDAQSDDTECDDAKNSNDEEDNDQVEARKNKPAKSDSKLSCVDQIPNDQFPLFSCLLWSVVHLSTQMIDQRALKSVMVQLILKEEGLQK